MEVRKDNNLPMNSPTGVASPDMLHHERKLVVSSLGLRGALEGALPA